MATAVGHASAAAEHSNDAASQLAQAIENLKETLSFIIGTEQDAVTLAASHMHQVAEIVGSTTARELSAGFQLASHQIKSAPTEGISEAIHALEQTQTLLNGLNDRSGQLAAQLGA